MKTIVTFSNRRNNTPLRRASPWYVVPALVVFGMCFGLDTGIRGDEPRDGGDDQGTQVLTRGPVHEAFAEVATFNPEPGVVVPQRPPENIEEVPPDEKPEGTNVTWIPGYWAWDDERSDFVWVSGVWRSLPPGRQWVPGYWAKTEKGYQWTSGYWADARASETTYLPPPPATVEVGPNIAPPSPDYVWVPGCWVWYEGRYAWRPGYWVLGRADWDWCPAYYVYTPCGYVFVDGYWDYCVERRGILFAPVYFEPGVYARRSFYYSPAIVIDLAVFPEHLFFRPRYHHCYFGDYYAASYARAGFYASFSFQSRYGYDPIFVHRRWEHRGDRDWDRRIVTTYQYRRDHEDARPPRTWAAQKNVTITKSKDTSLVVATSLDQLSKRRDSLVRLQPVGREEKQQLTQRVQEVRKSRDERRTLEASAVDTSNAKPVKPTEPTRLKLPKSPIVGKSADQLGKEQAPPTPHKTPQPDYRAGPRPEATPSESGGNKDNRQSEPPRREYREKSVPARPESNPQVEQPSKREARPEAERPARREAQPEAEQPSRREAKPEAKPEAERPSRPEARPESERPARERPAESDRGGTRPESRDRDKGEDQQTPGK